jgi:hypothetical protein
VAAHHVKDLVLSPRGSPAANARHDKYPRLKRRLGLPLGCAAQQLLPGDQAPAIPDRPRGANHQQWLGRATSAGLARGRSEPDQASEQFAIRSQRRCPQVRQQ